MLLRKTFGSSHALYNFLIQRRIQCPQIKLGASKINIVPDSVEKGNPSNSVSTSIRGYEGAQEGVARCTV